MQLSRCPSILFLVYSSLLWSSFSHMKWIRRTRGCAIVGISQSRSVFVALSNRHTNELVRSEYGFYSLTRSITIIGSGCTAEMHLLKNMVEDGFVLTAMSASHNNSMLPMQISYKLYLSWLECNFVLLQHWLIFRLDAVRRFRFLTSPFGPHHSDAAGYLLWSDAVYSRRLDPARRAALFSLTKFGNRRTIISKSTSNRKTHAQTPRRIETNRSWWLLQCDAIIYMLF